MIDNKIIKALEQWIKNYNGSLVNFKKLANALDLITRQQEEIEQLKFETAKLLPKDCPYAIQIEVSSKLEAQIKSKAIKDFAEKLCNGRVSNDPVVIAVNAELKEMVGEK